MEIVDSNLISIVMPVKNAMPYLVECLDSIINQSIGHWELIAIDDNSSDDSLAVLKKYSARDQRIIIKKNEGKGIIDALRLAYSHSSGQYITRMDADDSMSINKLEVLFNNLKEKGIGHLAVGKVKYFSETDLGDGYKQYENWLNRLIAIGSNFTEIYKECVIPSPCWMLHRSDLDRINAFNNNIYPEDYDLVFRMYQGGLTVIPCDETLHLWRDHPMRSSRNDANYSDNRFLALKCRHFIKYDYDPQRPLVLWGAGKKGKEIIKLIESYSLNIHWVTNNSNKIGKDIYGHILQDPSIIKELNNIQIIIAVANPEEQVEIKMTIDNLGKETLGEYYFFC